MQITALNHAKFMKNNLGVQDFIGEGKRMIIGPISSYKEDLDSKYADDNGLLNEPLEGLPPIFGGYLAAILTQAILKILSDTTSPRILANHGG